MFADDTPSDHGFDLEPPVERPRIHTQSLPEIEMRRREDLAREAGYANEDRYGSKKEKKEISDKVVSPDEYPMGDPPWLSFKGGLSFLVHKSVWPRWIGLSLALVPAIGFSMFVLGLLGIGGSLNIGAAFGVVYGVIAIVMVALVAAYTSVLCLTVIQDIATGCHTIYEWSDFNPSEWLPTLLYPIMAVFVSGTIAKLVWWATGSAAVTLFVGYLVFPIALAAEIESGAAWLPYSRLVFLSLRRGWKYWLRFYAESLAIIGVVVLTSMIANKFPYGSFLLRGPILAGALLLWSFFLGRTLYLVIPPVEAAEREAAEKAEAESEASASEGDAAGASQSSEENKIMTNLRELERADRAPVDRTKLERIDRDPT